ncbi:hypothetical protein ABPG75_004979 [Micractinium tetrahymenae]
MQHNPAPPAVAAEPSRSPREHVQAHAKRQNAQGDAQPTAEAAAAKRQRRTSGGNEWPKAWAWKREHRPDKVRFDRPYLHSMRLPSGDEVKLTVHQARFKATGFASTVWDSSIVLAKFFEKHPQRCVGKRCLDLSAGCGLPGLVLVRLGAASVTATDLGPNLPLLRKNSDANGCGLRVEEHFWGTPVDTLEPPFDIVVACDVMYIAEAVPPLVASLVALSGPATEVYISHGRNRQAEPQFLEAAGKHFSIETVRGDELDEVYQTCDVDVLRLRLRQTQATSEAAGGFKLLLRSSAMADPARKERRALEEDAVALQRAAKRLLAAAPALAGRTAAEAQPANIRAGTPMTGPLTQQPAAPQRMFRAVFPTPAPAVAPSPPRRMFSHPLQAAALPQPRSLPPHPRSMLALQAVAPRPTARPSHPRPPLAPANRQGMLPPSPGWPACSSEQARAASDDASSPRGQGLHVLAADVREAVSGGLSGRVSKSLEALLFISSGTSINAALATRNRKTDQDIGEPAPAVADLVRAFEALRGQLAAGGGEARAELMQEAWSAVVARVLRPHAGSVAVQLKQRTAARPGCAGEAFNRARKAVRACAEQAEAALASCGGAGSDAAALAALEAMQRFAVRTILPVAPASGLHAFPWLEAAVAALCPALRTPGMSSGSIWPATQGGPRLQAALAVLADLHDALEDAGGGVPEAQRQAVCRGVLTAAGAAALAGCLHVGAEQAVSALPCMAALGTGAASLEPLAERALAAAARLSEGPRPLAAASELLERGARLMRLEPSGWAAAVWPLLRALKLEV